MINNPIIYKFFKDFTYHRKKTNWAVVLAVDLSPIFLNTWTTDETFQHSGKHILKSWARVYESSGSQFFTTTNGIQLGLDTFDESRFLITFLTILVGSYINTVQFQISYRRENGSRNTWVIKIGVLRKGFSRLFCFIRCKKQHFQTVE